MKDDVLRDGTCAAERVRASLGRAARGTEALRFGRGGAWRTELVDQVLLTHAAAAIDERERLRLLVVDGLRTARARSR